MSKHMYSCIFTILIFKSYFYYTSVIIGPTMYKHLMLPCILRLNSIRTISVNIQNMSFKEISAVKCNIIRT